MTRAKWVVVILVVLAACFVGFKTKRALDARNEGFEIQKIYSTLVYDPEWDLPEPEGLEEILHQDYTYLGHGLQFYAFESADKRYVLKFMRHQRLRPPAAVEWLPNLPLISTFKQHKAEECKKRIGYIFRSLKVAYEDVPEETGLISVHLNKTTGHYPTIRLYDKLQNGYDVPLDETEFVLQRKARLIKPTLLALIQNGKLEEAKSRIDQIFALLRDCAQKGVCDTDSQLIRKDNLGFLDERAIYIDTGKLTRKASIKTKPRFAQDLQRLDPLASWLQAQCPLLYTHFQETKSKTLNTFN